MYANKLVGSRKKKDKIDRKGLKNSRKSEENGQKYPKGVKKSRKIWIFGKNVLSLSSKLIPLQIIRPADWMLHQFLLFDCETAQVLGFLSIAKNKMEEKMMAVGVLKKDYDRMMSR